MKQGGKKYSLSLCMIAKNEAENLPTLWQSVKRIVDEWIVIDTGSTDNTVEVARSLGATVYEEGDRFTTDLTQEHVDFFAKYGIKVNVGDKVFEFGKARNYSFSYATKDYILWLDGDDILIGSEKLSTIIDANLDPSKQLGLHLQYHYELDQYKNPVVVHYRERVLPNNGTFKWQGRIHEHLVPTLEAQYILVKPEDCYVLHNPGERNRVSRNTKNLLLDLYEQGDNPDPRTLFYLAESLKLEGQFDRARDLYEQYLKLSGWDEERCLAAIRLCNYYLVRQDYSKALEWSYRAIKERPDFPAGYSAVAQSYYGLEEFENSVRFARLAIDTDQPDTMTMVDQKYNKFIPLYLMSEIYLKRGQIKEALALAREAMKFEPLNDMLLKIQYSCERMLLEDEIVRAFGKTTEFLKDQGELEKAKLVIDNVPVSLDEDPRVLEVRKEIKGEMEKRSQNWINVEKRLQVDKPIDQQYLLLVNDLRKFYCQSVLLVSNEPLLATFLSGKGFKVKRVVKFDEVKEANWDAVFFDHNLHLIQNRLDFIDAGKAFATKYIGLSVPNRDPNALIACTVNHVEAWIGYGARTWNVLPLQNGVIYGSGIIGQPYRHRKITFFCGTSSIEEWGPLSHIEGGVGGSEEAVIYLSRELALKGHYVEVINSFPHPCIVEGVKWRHASSIKPDEQFDTLILWRIPHYLDEFNLKGNQIYLWMHDVPQTHWFTPERLQKITKIIALSKYHRTLLPDLPDDKFLISQNGVDLQQFAQDVERNPRKVIYTSSYDRGLEHLLRIWPEVRREVPDAELHIYYGWGTYDKLRTEPKQREWKSWMMEQFQQPGVFEHGRIDQVTLARELLSSSIFAYPCHFEEISCISAMKAQSAGCIPLTTDYAALAETNLIESCRVEGNPKVEKLTMDYFKACLIDRLKNETPDKIRQDIAKLAWSEFAWKKVANQWSQFIEEDQNVGSNSRRKAA